MSRRAACHTFGLIEAGCDEAGRGCLAGPVVAAAVILPAGVRLPGLNDSKKLNRADRERLRPLIEARALAWCVGMVDVAEIDRINILNAAFLAMHRAIDGLSRRPNIVGVDRIDIPVAPSPPHRCWRKSTGCASDLHKEAPHYGWKWRGLTADAPRSSPMARAGITAPASRCCLNWCERVLAGRARRRSHCFLGTTDIEAVNIRVYPCGSVVQHHKTDAQRASNIPSPFASGSTGACP